MTGSPSRCGPARRSRTSSSCSSTRPRCITRRCRDPLLSEALRGEGAVLRDEHGVAFMADEHPLADLAPRDVVARAITRRLVSRGLDHLWLDATSIDDFPARFPTIWGSAQAVGLDPTQDWLPVAPAAHYLCGGVSTDLDGATTLPGLWACGEAACSGVHGANRLASNSLLDGLVFAPRVVDAIVDGKDAADSTGVLRSGSARSVLPSPRTRWLAADGARRAATGDDQGRRRAARPVKSRAGARRPPGRRPRGRAVACGSGGIRAAQPDHGRLGAGERRAGA